MCGIALTINGQLHEVVKMGNAIKHRGIKNQIYEVDNLKVYFTLLPITDEAAPMQPYKSGKWTVWLNGYISNYKALTYKYGFKPKTNTDTEVLAMYIDKFDCDEDSLQDLNGFFAVVAYNGSEVKCFTDRYGIKQLYTYQKGKTTYISSEIKAISAVNSLEIDKKGVESWLFSLGVIDQKTIYRDVKRIRTLPFRTEKTIDIDYETAKKELKKRFSMSIIRNKVNEMADGVFLSGGIDSGIIARHINPKFCFSMDYQNQAFSEADNIKLNSAGTHLTMICNYDLYKNNIEKAINALDDLRAGSSYTNFALCEIASKFCRVIYSGAGGDEVFHGYTHRYSRPVEDSVKRTSFKSKIKYIGSHKTYDFQFLNAILVVEDRMSGHFTMETRYPLLDNDFVNFALSLPMEYRSAKRILKDISGLDPDVLAAKKRGFSNPHISNDEWVKLALNSKLTNIQQYEIRDMLHSF